MVSKPMDCVPWESCIWMMRVRKTDPPSTVGGLEDKNVAQEWKSAYAKLRNRTVTNGRGGRATRRVRPTKASWNQCIDQNGLMGI